MVSLINFKIVNEDLQEMQQQQQLYVTSEAKPDEILKQASTGQQLLIRVMQTESPQQNQHNERVGKQLISTINDEQTSIPTTPTTPTTINSNNIDRSHLQLVPIKHQSMSSLQHNRHSQHHQPQHLFHHLQNSPLQHATLTTTATTTTTTTLAASKQEPNYKQVSILFNHSNHPSPQFPEAAQMLPFASPNEASNFVVTWRNLKFAIGSTWHERVVGGSNSSVSKVTSNDTTSGQQIAQLNRLGPSQTVEQQQVATSKLVLDNLDGSFRSGELTAILGPSGAGKTTLLDCLTGNRKKGLSGSIRISASPSSSPNVESSCKCHFHYHCHHIDDNTVNNTKQQQHYNQRKTNHLAKNGQHISKLEQTQTTTDSDNSKCLVTLNQKSPYHAGTEVVAADSSTSNGNGDNLKVSIIPQNDHLMGHLTVYETLNYASKMKNCFDKQFDHKLNIKRVAQELGLLSCLGTRVNKLSGGQYKRVSIAQELLSSPDILILDEPTSGLDAMTCYQTVQVLKKLTDDRRSSGQNQIAVILTIHQPNSDVFQQFNHVYVVAQGGKCIYEGPPSSIESVINRVGIRLPSSYYNPATMIVEIAAGKFGYEAIEKLNSIQKKQYEFSLPDEQNSTGDSAVDCPSSSNDDDDDDDEDYEGNIDGVEKKVPLTSDSERLEEGMTCLRQQDDNNNCRSISEMNNNSSSQQIVARKQLPPVLSNMISVTDEDSRGLKDAKVGLVNKGFVMEVEEENRKTKHTKGDVVVVVQSQSEGQDDQVGVNNNNNIERDADSLDKIKMMMMMMNNEIEGSADVSLGESNMNNGNCNESRQRKKRRRTRKRSNEPQQVGSLNSDLSSGGQCDGDTSVSHRCTSRSLRLGRNQQQQQKSNRSDGCSFDSSTNSTACRGATHLEGSGAGMLVGLASGGNGGNGNNSSRQEKRLKLNSLKADQKFPFWRHTYLHFHRSWLSIIRDPMLCSMQLALHIIVPVMVSLVYGTDVGKPNACPRAGPMDIMAFALEPTDSALQLQEDFRRTMENIGYIFFKLYGIIFAAMTVTVLTFPLDMHVLVKEFRNGWYGLSSYFLGRTLADIPFQLTLPLLAMSLSYYATGQPYSYMQWRFLSITAILILSSLIAQSQGLLFGAILMDRMKAAVFVAPAATTPIILFAGFLVRTQSIPSYLRPLSNLSYLRYAIEACLISRYGFNQCDCDPAIFNQTVPELPPIARSMLDYWLSSFKASSNEQATSAGQLGTLDGLTASSNSTAMDSITDITTTSTLSPPTSGNPDLFSKLIDSLAKANSFGRNITSCDQVVPYPMIDYDLKDSQLINCFAILLFMLIFTRLLTFFIVCFKVKRKV